MWNWTYFTFLFVSVANCEYNKSEWKEVQIKQGPVRGYRDSSGELWTFYNIPYATAPTGTQKFKAPLPPPTWTEPFEAVDKTIICPQFVHVQLINQTALMQENCLIVNIYVPDTTKENLSVLIYVHGGGFQIGYGDMLKVKNLMINKNIISVNFNYRVGIHGFLCLGTDDVPGNAGMKDQVALLHWVQQNIANFGGNPSDATIAGYSAGSAAVDLLMISKEAEGLFHKVIPESGASLAAFTVQTDPLYNAKEHARKLNFTDGDDVLALEEFYKSLSYDILTSDAFLANTDSTFTFSPCVEHNRDGAFLTNSPYTILKTGDYKKVPLLYGFANMEGLLRIDLFDVWKDRMNEKFSDFLPPDLKFESKDEKETVARTIKEFYFGDKPVDKENILNYVDFFSDVFFAQSSLWVIKLHLEAGHDQIYLYEYTFVDENTPVVPHTNIRGANHCAQSMAVSDPINATSIEKSDLSKEYKTMKKIIREMWRNFITTGKPVPEESSLPEWPPVRANNSPYMSLGQNVELRDAIAPERFTFWQTLYQKYYKEPIPPTLQLSKSHIEL